MAAAVLAPAFSWTGFYVGGHVGYGWASSRYNDFTAAFGPASINANGFLGGVQAGYNWQMNNFVFGVEADMPLAQRAVPSLWRWCFLSGLQSVPQHRAPARWSGR